MKRGGKMLALAAMIAAMPGAIVVGDRDGRPDLPKGAKLAPSVSALQMRHHSRNRPRGARSQKKRRLLARRRNRT